MVNYLEILNAPAKVTLILAGVFLFTNIIGEILEFKGKVVPEFIKIRKYFARKKIEKKALSKLPDVIERIEKIPEVSETLLNVETLLNEVNLHYSADNIAMRDGWMQSVDDRLQGMKDLNKKIDKNNEDTLSLLIESKRSHIIDFASYVVDENKPVTHEQFKRAFKIYAEYEQIIKDNSLVNGEVDIAIRIIRDAYEGHMKNHSFIEDIRGYK